ncbi:cohesin domain-containing protein [Desulfofundulus thermosubterraneus]|uniref:Cohesin domain-containing protein n=1 Tax=Desulfofundulus thermosubterraneus DSM 16057 TaxID=1121432 RepID=A0A1M6GU05_9FIRM|nr:cohesin domain-containing protein [Desulfofundulus thermosubterraneus]SHJ13428.1 Cohesin domain-containing protein [Desulfofundulus thermosubterraneus DSM 16057]
MTSLAKSLRAAVLAVFFAFLLASVAFAAGVPQYIYFGSGSDIVKVDYAKARTDAMNGNKTLYNGVVQHVGNAMETGADVVVETDDQKVLDYQKGFSAGKRFADIVNDPAYRTGKPEAGRELRVENGRAVIVDIRPSAGPQITIGSSLTGAPGSTVQVPVGLTSTGEVAGVQFDVLFDKSLLAFQGVSAGELVEGQDWLVSGSALDGAARVIIANLAGSTIAGGTGTLAVITFRVADAAPAGAQSELALRGAVLSDADGGELTGVSLVSGRFTAQ